MAELSRRKPAPAPLKKAPEDDGRIWYRKIGGGSLHLRLDGTMKIIKPNQRFRARPMDIPAPFRDIIVPEQPEPPKKKIPEAAAHYDVVEIGVGEDQYNVVNKETGKPFNGAPLSKQDAETLATELN
jgi:hypothetical protein